MLTLLTAGESHGPQLTAILDGLPAGLPVSSDQIDYQLARRQKGYGRGGRMKIEQDRARILSGVRHGLTLGGPVTLVIENRDWVNWAPIMDPLAPPPEELSLKLTRLAQETSNPRPGHADLAGGIKWRQYDLRNVLERASARETAARVAAGALARQMLARFDISLMSHVVRIGEVAIPGSVIKGGLTTLIDRAEKSEVRCLDAATGKRMMAAIREAKKKRDSLGGIAEVIARGVPVGLGNFSQGGRRLDARLAEALMSIPSVKGVEIGSGFDAAARRGSVVHDEIHLDPSGPAHKKGFVRRTNNAGGIEGGISNGEDIVVRVAGKPLSTLNQPLNTVNVRTKKPAKAIVERTDTCVIPALGVVAEAMVALVLADAFMEKFGGDNLEEMRRHYQTWLETSY